MKVRPASPETWTQLESLFGPRGGYSDCWCMFWRMPRQQFKKEKGEGTKRELQRLVSHNEFPGVIAYEGAKAVGWCGVGPRENYAALENSRVLKRVDDKAVWSVVCFFVAKDARKKNAMEILLNGAVDYARKSRAKILEGYPLDMESSKLSGQKLSTFAGYMGIASAFKRVGFTKIGQASETQLIMRLML
jgi:GNAT superfamily N-acetyltransferase